MLPGNMAVFRYIEKTFGDSCRKWGYSEIRTPVLEYLHLFTAAGTLTPAKLGQAYSFLDWDGWSGERVVLRPDSTIPAARLFIDSLGAAEQARLYYVQNVFSFESTGRDSREKWQCGCEFIGGKAPVADAEIIFMAAGILKTLGIKDLEIQLSHAGLIRALLGEIEPDVTRQAELFDRILDGNAGDLKLGNGSGSGLGKAINLVLNYSGQAEGFLKNLRSVTLSSIPALKQPLDDFTAVAELLTPLNGKFKINVASGRGFEYYTGFMAQFVSGGMRIGGGGRYDDLVSLIGGAKSPACGYALYLDRLAEVVTLPVSPDDRTVAIVTGNSRSLVREGFALGQSLRDSGFSAIIESTADRIPADTHFTVTLAEEGGGVTYLLGEKGKKPVKKLGSAERVTGEMVNRAKAGSA